MTTRRHFLGLAAGAIAGSRFMRLESAWADDDALVAAARKEGQLVWYTTMLVDQVARPIIAAFQKKYPGIDVLPVRGDDNAITLKIMTETRANNPQGDMFDGVATIGAMRDANLVAQYTPPSAALYPPDLRDPDGYWTPVYLLDYVVAYNSKFVPPDQAPKTFEDILDPRWDGKIVFNPSNPVGLPLFVGRILKEMGDDKGMDYLKQLAKLHVHAVELSGRTILDQVIAGEYLIDPMRGAADVMFSKDQGAPCDAANVEPVGVVLTTMGLLKQAPHPNAAKLFLDFLASQQGQEMIRDFSYIPALPSVPPKWPQYSQKDATWTATYWNGVSMYEPMPNWKKITDQLFR